MEAPPPPPPPPPPAVNVEDVLRNALSTIYFDYDRTELRPEAINALGRAGSVLREYPSVKVMAEGHADERGTSAYNMGLGESRARVVRDYLVSYGISADRIQITSYGKERPANPNCNGVEECHAKNRRVEWRILSL
jgi:peptidoglycan-associated lipoprotein